METNVIPAWRYVWKCLHWRLLSMCQISCLYQKAHIHLKFRAMPPDYAGEKGPLHRNLVPRVFRGSEVQVYFALFKLIQYKMAYRISRLTNNENKYNIQVCWYQCAVTKVAEAFVLVTSMMVTPYLPKKAGIRWLKGPRTLGQIKMAGANSETNGALTEPFPANIERQKKEISEDMKTPLREGDTW